MRLIIDLPDTGIEETIIERGDWEAGSLFDTALKKALKTATRIPEGVTNGDVIRAMFPKAEIEERDDTFGIVWEKQNILRFLKQPLLQLGLTHDIIKNLKPSLIKK